MFIMQWPTADRYANVEMSCRRRCLLVLQRFHLIWSTLSIVIC